MSGWKSLKSLKPQDGQLVFVLSTLTMMHLTIGRYDASRERVMIQYKNWNSPEVVEQSNGLGVKYWLPLDADESLLDAHNWPGFDDLNLNAPCQVWP